MFKVSALSLERNDQQIFSNLTFNVEAGTLVRILGSNGSGKSSLLKVLAGLWKPSSGTVCWRGEPLATNAPFFASERCYLGHQLGLQPALSPLQNLKLWLQVSGVRVTLVKIGEALERLGLADLEDPCDNLSRGECQRVALAMLWLNPPVCWILDEPFTALDRTGIEVVCQQFGMHLKKGGLIFMATHQVFDIPSPQTLEIQLGEY